MNRSKYYTECLFVCHVQLWTFWFSSCFVARHLKCKENSRKLQRKHPALHLKGTRNEMCLVAHLKDFLLGGLRLQSVRGVIGACITGPGRDEQRANMAEVGLNICLIKGLRFNGRKLWCFYFSQAANQSLWQWSSRFLLGRYAFKGASLACTLRRIEKNQAGNFAALSQHYLREHLTFAAKTRHPWKSLDYTCREMHHFPPESSAFTVPRPG